MSSQTALSYYIQGRVGGPFTKSKITGLTAADLAFVDGMEAAASGGDAAIMLASWLSRLTEPAFTPWYCWVAELAREFARRGVVRDVGRFNGLGTLCTAPLEGRYADKAALDAAFRTNVRAVLPSVPYEQGAAAVCAHLHALAYGGPMPDDTPCADLCSLTHPLQCYRV